MIKRKESYFDKLAGALSLSLGIVLRLSIIRGETKSGGIVLNINILRAARK